MKILIFSAYYYPHTGGVETYIKELFSGLDVTIITCNTENSKSFEKIDGFDVYRFECYHLINKTYPVLTIKSIKKINTFIKKNKHNFDYVITHTRFFNISLIGTILSKKYCIKHIHFEHGTEHSPIKNPFLNIFGKLYDHIFGRYIIKTATQNVGISKASEKFIKHLCERQTNCIYNSIDTKFFKKTKTSLKKELKINGRIILFVGRIIYAKGVQDLLEATDDIDATIIIMGDGPYRTILEEQYKNRKNILFLGQKNSVQIREFLSIADIFVNPSHAEGLPTSVLEAGSVGVPIIATDVGGTKEIIIDNINGFLIQPKNISELRKKIKTLLYSDKLKKQFSNNISEKIKTDFDWKNSRKKLKNLL